MKSKKGYVKPINKYRFKRIDIPSSPCHGACPIFQLSINSSGIVNYQQSGNVYDIEDLSGKISQKDLDLLRTQIDKVARESLEKEYWSESSGGQYFNVEMVDHTGNTFRVLTHSQATTALPILIWYAYRIAESNKLKATNQPYQYATDFRKN